MIEKDGIKYVRNRHQSITTHTQGTIMLHDRNKCCRLHIRYNRLIQSILMKTTTLIAEAYDHEYLTMNIDKKHTKMRDCTSIVFQVENIAPACNSI